MRLRPLSEAECYARCYGGRREENVVVLRPGGVERPADETPRHERGEPAEAEAA